MKKNLLFIGFVLVSIIGFSQAPSYVPTAGLVGYWPFSGNANDQIGNGNNGTVNGATLTTDRNGNSNSAYSVNGSSDYILISNSSTLNSASKSISVWANFSSEPTDLETGAMALVTKWYQVANCNNLLNDSYALVLSKSNNETKFIGATNLYTQSTLTTDNSLDTNLWYHVVFTHDSTTGGNIYINGVLISSNSTSGDICSNQNDLLFGADNKFGSLGRHFNGKLDDIGMWNRAVSQAEITS